MAYEIFTRKVVRAGSPTIAISKSGRIMLNKAATITLQKNAVEYVLVLWDKDRHRIGVRPITKKDPRAYTLKYAPKNAGAYFSAKTFFDYIAVDYSKTRAIPAAWDAEEALLEAEIPSEFLRDERQQRLIEIEAPVELKQKRNTRTG